MRNTTALARWVVAGVALSTLLGCGRQAEPADLAGGGTVVPAGPVHASPSPTSAPTSPAASSRTATTPAGGRPTATPTHAGRVVYLTFDDGPNPEWTPQVLDLLERYDARATFFVMGTRVQKYPELPRRAIAAGHRVGNHTWDHAWLTKLGPAQIADELTRTDTVLGRRTTCMRPPGGFVDAKVRAAVARQHKTVEMWDDDTRDWSKPGVGAIVDAALATSRRSGATVLLHDGGGDRSQSVAALRRILPALAAKGYRFESLPTC